MKPRRRSDHAATPPDREHIRRAFLGLALCHELRQPLHSANLNLELLSKRLGKQPVDPRNDIVGPMKALGRVVDRLNVSIDAFSSRALPDPVPSDAIALAPILADCVERAAERAQGAGVKIVLQASGIPDAPVHDEQIAVALDALIDNALRASSAGSEVVVSGTSSDDDLRIEVSDRGTGMDAEVVRHAVEIGFSTWGGAGIGLTVAKFITYHHGGAFQVNSTPGRGTTVTVTLPITEVRD